MYINRTTTLKRLLTVTFLCPLFIFCQAQTTITLKLSKSDCRKNEVFIFNNRDTIQFFQHNQLTNEISLKNYRRWPILIDSFKTGTYDVFYKNLYGKKVSKTIVIRDTATSFDLHLCTDALPEYSFNSLADLKNRETIKISFTTYGCFNNDEETLYLTKKGAGFVASLVTPEKTKSVKLDSSRIAAFIRFENEIRELKDVIGCTSVDTYLITIGTFTLKRTDGGCLWNGFRYLKKALFGEPGKG
jgi:hypothetical protein